MTTNCNEKAFSNKKNLNYDQMQMINLLPECLKKRKNKLLVECILSSIFQKSFKYYSSKYLDGTSRFYADWDDYLNFQILPFIEPLKNSDLEYFFLNLCIYFLKEKEYSLSQVRETDIWIKKNFEVLKKMENYPFGFYGFQDAIGMILKAIPQQQEILDSFMKNIKGPGIKRYQVDSSVFELKKYIDNLIKKNGAFTIREINSKNNPFESLNSKYKASGLRILVNFGALVGSNINEATLRKRFNKEKKWD